VTGVATDLRNPTKLTHLLYDHTADAVETAATVDIDFINGCKQFNLVHTNHYGENVKDGTDNETNSYNSNEMPPPSNHIW